MSTTFPAGWEPYADIRKIDFGMSFGIIATEAAECATVESTEQLESSQIEQTHDRIELNSAKYTTLEHNMFVLDGSMTLYPEEIKNLQTGWVSKETSNHNGGYRGKAKLNFKFSKPQDFYGVTLVFDKQNQEEIPKLMRITFFNSAKDILSKSFEKPKGTYHQVNIPIKNCSEIKIEFLNSRIFGRRARLSEVVFGVVAQYDSDSIVSASERHQINLLSESLASKELTVTIDNKEKLYNLINPQGVYEYLQSGQYVNYWMSINGVMSNMGVRYYKSAGSTDSGLTASITFTDRLIFLDDVKYNNGKSGTWTLLAAINDILSVAKISTVPIFEDMLSNVIIRSCIPRDTSCREAIRMCAQAAMCVCYIDKNDRLHFFKPAYSDDFHNLTRDTLHDEPDVNISEKLNAVKITRRDVYIEHAEDESFTASVAAEGELQQEKNINNPLVNNLEVFANWALTWVQKRTSFNLQYRGNPLLEVGDTAKIYDSFEVNGNAIVESHDITFDGGAQGIITARRI